jgi:hypothetical protein
MKKNKAIQIIGTQRSGSNLLRVMLNQIQEIDAPHPPHILHRFYSLLPKYGDLDKETNYLKLIDDVCRVIELNPVPWEDFCLDRELIRELCKTNTLVEVFNAIYTLKSVDSNASYWCCKSMANISYAHDLEVSGIKPYYIHLYRDGRDVALSFKKAIVGPKHIYHLANKWKKEQDMCLELKKNVDANRFFSICYEDLIVSPKAVLQKLCAFLGITFNDTMLQYYNSSESLKTASSGKMWKNISQPILKHNSNKFLSEMNADDMSLFESIAGTTLLELNYKLYADTYPNSISKEDIKEFHLENEMLIKNVAIKADKGDVSRKKAQLQLLKEIANRGVLHYANV